MNAVVFGISGFWVGVWVFNFERTKTPSLVRNEGEDLVIWGAVPATAAAGGQAVVRFRGANHLRYAQAVLEISALLSGSCNRTLLRRVLRRRLARVLTDTEALEGFLEDALSGF